MKTPKPVANPPATHVPVGGPDPVVGNAASAQPGGQAPDNGGDWLAEATLKPQAKPADGVPIDTRQRGDTHRGQATESKRGQRG